MEQAILDYISVWPSHGPRRIAQQLGQPEWGGYLISTWGVYKTLRRRGMNKRPSRLRRFELIQARATGILTQYTRELVESRPAEAGVEAKQPGELVGVDTFYVGRLKGVGKVWQSASDVASSYTFVWLSNANDSEHAADFAELVSAHYRDWKVDLERMLTDNGPEYVGSSFRDRLAMLGIEHTRIKPGRPTSNGHVERFTNPANRGKAA